MHMGLESWRKFPTLFLPGLRNLINSPVCGVGVGAFGAGIPQIQTALGSDSEFCQIEVRTFNGGKAPFIHSHSLTMLHQAHKLE
jgi:hypothetical protein